jgi:hypothetical protein
MMLSAQAAIHRFQLHVALGRVLQSALLVAGVASVAVLPFVLKDGYDASIGLATVMGVWVMLSITSAKNSRLLAPSPALIAAGEFEEAEKRIDAAMRAFSLSRTSKLLGLHHLAVLRHRQRRWQDVATLCRAVLGQRLVTMPGMERSTRLILADALLEQGDAGGAGAAIAPLRGTALALSEQLTLLQVELDVQARQQSWDAMLAGLPYKVQLAELMPAPAAARVQAMLALAAQKRTMPDWAEWLRRRVELLADVGKLTAEREALWELWTQNAPATAAASSES